jgi:hypothetical protein
MLLGLLDECSQEQLETVRALVTGAMVNAPAKEEEPMTGVEEFETKSRQMAMELWDAMKTTEDPAAAELPEETLEKITLFAKAVRNRTLDDISAAVEKAYSKFTATVVESLQKQKE